MHPFCFRFLENYTINRTKTLVFFATGKEEEPTEKELAETISEVFRSKSQERIDTITDVFTDIFLHDKMGCVQFGGYVINPCDFSAMRFDGFNVKVEGKEE